MSMEAFVLLGGFAAVGVLGFLLMSKLDNWLATLQNNGESFGQVCRIKIAASQPDSIPGITAILKDFSVQYPEFRCTLFIGQEDEIANALACGSVDMAVLSDHTTMPSMWCQDIRIHTQSVSIMDDTIDMRTLDSISAHQHLLWNERKSTPYLSELIRQFCQQ